MNFYSKILLFGEYGLLLGGVGFAIPFSKFSSKLIVTETNKSVHSHQSLQSFYTYLESQSELFSFLNLKAFEKDLAYGMWLDSDIPSGYGLGSSGALVAAIYAKYSDQQNLDIFVIKNRLAQMESYFHGSSSGIDPTVSYLNQPILIQHSEKIDVLRDWTLAQLGLSVFLVDTKTSAKTMSLVDWFKTHQLYENFKQRTNEDLLAINRKIISSIADGGSLQISDLLTISRFQLDYLSPMVPDGFRKHFFYGIENGDFAFKLCGSGGGGFMLCFSSDKTIAENYFKEQNLSYLHVE